jgi:hypothetical protein
MTITWTTPITDRTASDVITKTSKGFFNVVDWVRINGDTKYVAALSNLLFNAGISIVELTAPTIRTIPSIDDFNQFVENIETVRVGSIIPANNGIIELNSYLSGQNVVSPDYNDVNSWENNLLLIRQFIIASALFMVPCGVGACGADRYWQNRFEVVLSIGDL